MKENSEIIISGIGGQGMILCGTLIAKAAVEHDHKLATLTASYGVETRGTFSKSDVVIHAAGNPIYFPEATKPDLVLCLHETAYQVYAGKLGEQTLLIYNSDLVKPEEKLSGRQTGIALSTLAKQAGNPATANIITMGVVLGHEDVISPEGARAAISAFFAAKGETVIAMNLAAFDTGYALGKEIRAAQ